MSRGTLLIYHQARNKTNYNFKSIGLGIIDKVKLHISFCALRQRVQIITLKKLISCLNLIIQYRKQNQMDFIKQLTDAAQMRYQLFMRNLQVDFDNFDKPTPPSSINIFQSLLERSIAIISSKNELHFNQIYDYLQAPSSNCSDKIENQKQDKIISSVQAINQQIQNKNQFHDCTHQQIPTLVQPQPILNIPSHNQQCRQKQHVQAKIYHTNLLDQKFIEINQIEHLSFNKSQDMSKDINENPKEINENSLSTSLYQNKKQIEQMLPSISKTYDLGEKIIKRDIAKQFEQRRLQIINRQAKANKMIKSLLSERNPQQAKKYQEIKKKQLQAKLEDNIIFLKQIESNKNEKKNQISEWRQSSVQKDLLEKIKASNKQKLQSLGFSKSKTNKYNKYARGNIEVTPHRQKVNHFPKIDKTYTIFKPVPYSLYNINQKANQFYKI